MYTLVSFLISIHGTCFVRKDTKQRQRSQPHSSLCGISSSLKESEKVNQVCPQTWATSVIIESTRFEWFGGEDHQFHSRVSHPSKGPIKKRA